MNLRRFAKLPNQGATLRAQTTKVLHAPGDDRLFAIASLNSGRVYQISPDGSNVSQFFAPNLLFPGQFRQIRDLAFHPQFNVADSPGYGKVYALLVVSKPPSPTTVPYIGPSDYTFGDGLVTEFNAVFDGQGKMTGLDSASRRDVFRVAQKRADHPAGEFGFNPFATPGDEDYGLLYVTHGDSYQFLEGGQNGLNGLGKTFRVNPLQNGANSYSVPATNPFVNDPNVLDEIWTMGHRNPHTLTFAEDNQGKMHLLIAEIGEAGAEEINMVSEGGSNFGWSYMEGTLPVQGTHSDSYTYPVAQFGHNGTTNQAISGGYAVKNGSELGGHYFLTDFAVFGDTFTFNVDNAVENAVLSGPEADIAPAQIERVNFLFDDDDNPNTPSVATTLRDIITDDPDYDNSNRLDIRYGQGPGGELYVVNKRNGWIYLVTNSVAPSGDADFDADGDVDGSDFLTWQRGLGTGSTLQQGDANNDGAVDQQDLAVWKAQVGNSTLPPANVVPEPSTVALLFCGLLMGAARMRGRNQVVPRIRHKDRP